MTIIEQIKDEVERLKIKEPQSAEADGYNMAIADLLSIIEEKSGKPMNQEGLENEAVSYCFDNGLNLSPRTATDFARHFYELGLQGKVEVCEDLEQEIQSFWNRASGFQPKFVTLEVKENGFAVIARHFAQWGAEHFRDLTKKMGDSSEIPADLEEAAEQFYPQDSFDTQAARELGVACFVDGAKWQKEQMMKDAVEGKIVSKNDGWNSLELPSTFFGELSQKCNHGDKVRIIVVKE